MVNKKGQIGNFVVTFVATIIVIIILILFVFFSTAFKESSNAANGEAILNEDSLGIENGAGYMSNYLKLAEARNFPYLAGSFSDVLQGVGYSERSLQ